MQTEYDYIASYIIDVVDNEPEMSQRDFLTLKGGVNEECYFIECADNTTLDDILKVCPLLGNGVHRVVVGVTCFGDGPDHNGEYDAWEEFDFIALHTYNDDEAELIRKFEEL